MRFVRTLQPWADDFSIPTEPPCQNSISRARKKACMILFLPLKNRRKTCYAPLRQVLRRFFVVFLFKLYSIDNQWDTKIYVFRLRLFLFKNRAKRLQDSQSCPVKQSILRHHFDYFAVPLWLSCPPKHSKWHNESLWMTPWTAFPDPKTMIFRHWRRCKKVSAAGALWYDLCRSVTIQSEFGYHVFASLFKFLKKKICI